MSLYLDMKIRKIAHEMNIDKLLRKLSVGDMVATEAKYHRACFRMAIESIATIKESKLMSN